jgi:hypothetical protein
LEIRERKEECIALMSYLPAPASFGKTKIKIKENAHEIFQITGTTNESNFPQKELKNKLKAQKRK